MHFYIPHELDIIIHIFFYSMTTLKKLENQQQQYLPRKKLQLRRIEDDMSNFPQQTHQSCKKKSSMRQENQKKSNKKNNNKRKHFHQVLIQLKQLKSQFETYNDQYKQKYNRKNYKYFSKNRYKYFLQQNQTTLPIKQDQRKSIQSNLIYNVLKYLKWQNLAKYFFHNPSKKKILKMSTFKQSILQGRLFQAVQNSQKYKISNNMLKKSLQNLQNTDHLYEYLFLKAKYIKIYESSQQIFSARMLFSIYKLSQLIQIIKSQIKQRQKNNLLQYQEFKNKQNEQSQIKNHQIEQQKQKQKNFLEKCQQLPTSFDNQNNFELDQEENNINIFDVFDVLDLNRFMY